MNDHEFENGAVVGCLGKSSFNGKEGTDARLENNKEWIWGKKVETLN